MDKYGLTPQQLEKFQKLDEVIEKQNKLESAIIQIKNIMEEIAKNSTSISSTMTEIDNEMKRVHVAFAYIAGKVERLEKKCSGE